MHMTQTIAKQRSIAILLHGRPVAAGFMPAVPHP
jgi:hypothetical protein